jgi:NitT/TauT family transport system substrate-binding protein
MRAPRTIYALLAVAAITASACQGAAPGASPTGAAPTGAGPTVATTTAAATAAATTAAATTAAATETATATETAAATSPAATDGSPAPTAGGAPATVRLQLQWAPQAQFAGYFAADKEGFYTAENLTVQILPGGPDVIPQQVGSAPTGPEFTISWVPKVLEARESGSDLVNIAQVFQRSGTLSVSWKDSNITKPEDFKGKKVGAWGFGNEFEVTAAATKAGLKEGVDYEKVTQPFDMSLLLNREIDVAEAMIYNEYAQVLEAKNPATGELYKPEDLNVIDYNQVGTAMLQDAIFARKAWLAEAGNEDIAVRFLRASFRGWMFCRDNPDKCVEHTLEAGPTLGEGHQRWMMNEVNPLIWPSPNGIGTLDPAAYQQTLDVAKGGAVIKADPSPDAFRTDLAERAREGMTEDVNGTNFQKGTVEVTEGGQ